MSNTYVLYDDINGEILSIIECSPDDMVGYSPSTGVDFEEINDIEPELEYIDVNTRTKQPKTAATADVDKTTVTADGVDEVTLTGCSNGNRINVYFDNALIDSFIYNPANSSLTFNTPGAYTIEIIANKKLNKEVVINAT